MKKWLYVVIFCLIVATSSIAQSIDKIAIVNISSIFQQSSQRALATKQLENEFKNRFIELQTIEHDLQIKIKKFQHDESTMKSSERNLLEKSIVEQRELFSNKAQTFEQDKRRRQMEERNKILSSIQNAVRDIAIKKGYDVVLDTSAVAYINNIKDITFDVLKQIE